MSLGQAKRKLTRIGKTAIQFRITSTFEFIELECKGTWRPEKLRVIWLRNHRKVKSNDTTWTIREDFGPNGAKGRAIFSPVLSVSLVVTLYRDANTTEFEEKEYKYHVESEGSGGKKILATFNCNVADFVGIPSTKQALDLNFKCVSKKVSHVRLGITLESMFMKEGGAQDDDMQSTFSAISSGMESVIFDDDDDEEEKVVELDVNGTGTLGGNRLRLNTLKEESENEVGVADLESVIDNTASTTAVSSFDHATSSLTSQQRQVIESNETYVSPPNPYLEDEGLEMEIEAEPKNPCLIEMWIDSSVVLVDCFEGVVNHDKLNTVDIIGLYFSAGWCPPCRKFLPKLVKFYHHLKQHGKSFELIYVSSDYSKQDMVKYMKEQQMPWLGVEYGEESSEILRKKFKVVAVPMLKILGIKGNLIEESAKRPIEGASSGSAILKLYNKWYNMLEEERASTTALSNTDSKKTLFGKVKASIQGKEKGTEQDSLVALGTKVGSPVASSVRLSLDTHTRTKVKSAKADDVTQELLDEKEDRIQHLEEVNRTLKQTNDDHMEEIEELRQKLALLSSELDQIKSTSKTLQDESKELIANLNMRGWLYKRGLRGPTANIWRRRYFRLDQGSNLYYYKNSSEGNPQGYIDLDKVLNVQEVISAQQDKNHATFLVQCDGRTFQLQAHDETSMRRWMEAISYITNWRKKTVPKNMGAHP